jgi:hypothetical protein
MASDAFYKTFISKGCQNGLMESFSVNLINDDGAALIGCASLLRSKVANPVA